MKRAGPIAVLTLCAVLAVGVIAAAAPSRRPRCTFYRCTTLAQDRLVQVMRGETREEVQHEAILGLPHYWLVWRPTGRRRPLPSSAASPSRVAVAGRWVAWAEFACNHETSECGVGVDRVDVDSGRHEQNSSPPVDRGEEAHAPGYGCFGYGTTGDRSWGVTALVAADTGTVAWIQLHHVCELPHDSGVPVLLANNPDIEPARLRLEGGHVYWREAETLRSAPLS